MIESKKKIRTTSVYLSCQIIIIVSCQNRSWH